MKEAALNLLVFLLAFAAILIVELAFSALFLFVVPGGTGSFFSNPTSGAVYPALIGALLVASARAAKKTNFFPFTYGVLLLAAFLLLSLSFPLTTNTPAFPSVRTPPVSLGEFWALSDDAKLYLPDSKTPFGQFFDDAVLIPKDAPIQIIPQAQYDPWNRRFVFPGLIPETLSWSQDSVDQKLFAYPLVLKHLESDFYTVYSALRKAWPNDQLYFFVLSFLFVWLFFGLQVFFEYETWPLVLWLLVLTAARILLYFAVFCVSGVPSILAPWLPTSEPFRDWAGLGVLALAGFFLFFLNLLIKPNKKQSEV